MSTSISRGNGMIVDTSVWIDFFAGERVDGLEEALRLGLATLTPVVAAELISGARNKGLRAELLALLARLPCHSASLQHWIRVGHLRRQLRGVGISVSTPDAHIAQCALDRNAPLLTRDKIFSRIAEQTLLQVSAG